MEFRFKLTGSWGAGVLQGELMAFDLGIQIW